MPRTFGLDKRDPATGMYRKACICGHDHLTDRGEPISLCLECDCIDQIERCQNCGEEGNGTRVAQYEVCSRRCALQVEHMINLNTKGGGVMASKTETAGVRYLLGRQGPNHVIYRDVLDREVGWWERTETYGPFADRAAARQHMIDTTDERAKRDAPLHLPEGATA